MTSSVGSPAGTRRGRAERRRAEILAAAAETMMVTGYHETTMQTIAAEAGISVGLIYQYFPNKEDVLLSVIVDVLEGFRSEVPPAIEAAGDDPEAQLRLGFAAFCRVIDERRAGTLLAYRESPTLAAPGRGTIMGLENETIAPLREAVARGVRAGVFRNVSEHLVAHNLKVIAHSWALKHWDLKAEFTIDEYVDAQLELILDGLRPRPAG